MNETLEDLYDIRSILYDDCVEFNDCSICPHYYIENKTCDLKEINRRIYKMEKEMQQ